MNRTHNKMAELSRPVAVCLLVLLLASSLVGALWLGMSEAAPAQAAGDTPVDSPIMFSSLSNQGATASTVLTVAVKYDVTGLDPAIAWEDSSWLVAGQIYEGLISFEPMGFKPKPGLAESWNVSPNGLEWTFQIRPGVKFHDGTDLDASAVLFNFQRWWDPAHPYHVVGGFERFTYLFGGFKGDTNSLISALSAPNNQQFKIELKRPAGYLPSMLAMPPVFIASPAAVMAGTLMTTPVGTGPFKYVERVPDDHITLVANNNHWSGGPRLSDLIFEILPDDNGRFAALQSGAVQSASDLPSNFADLAGSVPGLAVYWHPPMNSGYLGINRAHGPLDQLLVRQAIAHAIDKRTLLDNYYTTGDLVAKDLLPPSIWGSDPSLPDYTYNPSLAISLLDQAGYPNGFATTLAYRDVYRDYLPDPVSTAQAIQSYLAAVGITASVQEYDSSTFIQKVNNGELDLFLLGWIADYPHASNFYNGVCVLALGPKDVTLCNQLEAALSEDDIAAQETIYQWASGRIHDTLPLVPLAHGREPLITYRDLLGVRFAPYGALYDQAVFASNWNYLPMIIK